MKLSKPAMDPGSHDLDALARPLPRRATCFKAVCHVASNGHVRKQRVVLKHNADIADVGWIASDVLSINQHRSVGWN